MPARTLAYLLWNVKVSSVDDLAKAKKLLFTRLLRRKVRLPDYRAFLIKALFRDSWGYTVRFAREIFRLGLRRYAYIRRAKPIKLLFYLANLRWEMAIIA